MAARSLLALLVIAALAVAVGSCDAGDETAAVDAAQDIAVDVQNVPAPGVRQPSAAAVGNIQARPPAAAPTAPAVNPAFDSPIIAGANLRQPSAADPVADKRNFHIAWLRVSMPTGGPGASGTVTAVFAPKPGGDKYWKVVDSEVLCPTGKPSVRGTNLKDIDCGHPDPVVEPEPAIPAAP